MSEQKTLQEQIVARAMQDEAFCQELLSNPKAAVERDYRWLGEAFTHRG